ncbi:hypothetical protein [Hyphomicrobium sp. CS1GBMeth3]|uniref:hypothetical protein n=1 Tax=Hyphomicrobium sp. CS1GBMeth3 TaxID=1892845 RepID=UPI0009319814|nr:hypothetical protein [Hyphomicrobium sp. CS1GBMeth3]
MLHVIAIASNALQVESRKLSEIASAVAATGPSAGGQTAPVDRPTPVRIGALPLGGPLEGMVSLKEAELAYGLNAAVIATADEMADTLLEVFDRDTR